MEAELAAPKVRAVPPAQVQPAGLDLGKLALPMQLAQGGGAKSGQGERGLQESGGAERPIHGALERGALHLQRWQGLLAEPLRDHCPGRLHGTASQGAWEAQGGPPPGGADPCLTPTRASTVRRVTRCHVGREAREPQRSQSPTLTGDLSVNGVVLHVLLFSI